MKTRVRFFRMLILGFKKLFRIKDTPHNIALGFGLGVFTGILPGTGPIAAIVLSLVLKLNRVSTLAGSLITNTWTTFFIMMISIKFGLINETQSRTISEEWLNLIKHFNLPGLYKLLISDTFLPVLIVFVMVNLVLSISAYIACYTFLKIRQAKITKRQ